MGAVRSSPRYPEIVALERAKAFLIAPRHLTVASEVAGWRWVPG